MEQAISAYGNLMTWAVSVVQRLGALTIPLGIVALIFANMWGGSKAIQAIGIGIVILGALALLLAAALGIANSIGSIAAGGTAAVTGTPVPKP